MAETLPTTELSTDTTWGLGSSGPGVRPGFSQTEDNLPKPNDLWPGYYDNVMRGRQDGPWYDETGFYSIVDYSRTYVEPSSTGEVPPKVDPLSINGDKTFNGEDGEPWGGMRPTIVSPGAGQGVNYSAIEGTGISPTADGSGTGEDGSVQGPYAASTSQESCVDGASRSPVYYAGYAGYSNPTGT